MLFVMTTLSLPAEELPVQRTVMTSHSSLSSIEESILLDFHLRTFSTIRPLHWTKDEYCFILVLLVSVFSAISIERTDCLGDITCQIQTRTNHMLWYWAIHLFVVLKRS